MKSHFEFNKHERSGIFFLLLLIVLLQLGYFVSRSVGGEELSNSFSINDREQNKIDSLKKSVQNDRVTVFPFNPNFITDYRGYKLGMSTQEIDRLHKFRTSGKFVNSTEEFQQVTRISDSLLNSISPFFKFPKWVVAKNSSKSGSKEVLGAGAILEKTKSDLNSATTDDLKAIKGIGSVLSTRIVKFRNRLGGFAIDEQLYEVYGLKPHVAKRILVKFKVISVPKIEKINLTWASYNELCNLLYISPKFAKSIIEYRKNRRIISFSELQELDGFPEGKLDRLQLYLSL